MHKITGKPTIHPALFYSGKIAGYITWGILVAHISGMRIQHYSSPHFVQVLAYFLLGIGAVFTVSSLIHLGNSTSLGLPAEKTELKTHGLYRISRNPMYVGFNLFTIAAVLLAANYWVDLLALYSLVIYHFIILGEEAFLEERFGEAYSRYCQQTRRYL